MQTIFDEYIAFPLAEYDEVLFGKLVKLLGSVEEVEEAFQLHFPENEEGSAILGGSPTLYDAVDPLPTGKGHRFTIKVGKGIVRFFVNCKLRSTRDEK